jgi:hypothetical protein
MTYSKEGLENSLISLIRGVLHERGYAVIINATKLDDLMSIAKKVLDTDDEETIILLAKLRG